MKTELDTCNRCDGTGEIKPDVVCPKCEGSGQIDSEPSGRPDATPSKEAKHTPAPWKVYHPLQMFVIDSTGRSICEILPHKTLQESEANAELIARAPMLLQEVEDLRKEGTFRLDTLKKLESFNDEVIRERDQLRERNRVLEEAAQALIKADKSGTFIHKELKALAAVLSRNESKTPNEE